MNKRKFSNNVIGAGVVAAVIIVAGLFLAMTARSPQPVGVPTLEGVVTATRVEATIIPIPLPTPVFLPMVTPPPKSLVEILLGEVPDEVRFQAMDFFGHRAEVDSPTEINVFWFNNWIKWPTTFLLRDNGGFRLAIEEDKNVEGVLLHSRTVSYLDTRWPKENIPAGTEVVVSIATGGSGDPIYWETTLSPDVYYPWGLYCREWSQADVLWYRPLGPDDEGRVGIVRYDDRRPDLPIIDFTVEILTVGEKREALSNFQQNLRDEGWFFVNYPREWEEVGWLSPNTVWGWNELPTTCLGVRSLPPIRNGWSYYSSGEALLTRPVVAFTIVGGPLLYRRDLPSGSLVCGDWERQAFAFLTVNATEPTVSDREVEEFYRCLSNFYGPPNMWPTSLWE